MYFMYYYIIYYSVYNPCSCGSVVEHCVSSTKVVGSIPREHSNTDNVYPKCKLLWIKASAKCINVNVIFRGSCTKCRIPIVIVRIFFIIIIPP